MCIGVPGLARLNVMMIAVVYADQRPASRGLGGTRMFLQLPIMASQGSRGAPRCAPSMLPMCAMEAMIGSGRSRTADHGLHCGRTRGCAPTPMRISAEPYVTPGGGGERDCIATTLQAKALRYSYQALRGLPSNLRVNVAELLGRVGDGEPQHLAALAANTMVFCFNSRLAVQAQ
jgi:hypothetical protein